MISKPPFWLMWRQSLAQSGTISGFCGVDLGDRPSGTTLQPRTLNFGRLSDGSEQQTASSCVRFATPATTLNPPSPHLCALTRYSSPHGTPSIFCFYSLILLSHQESGTFTSFINIQITTASCGCSRILWA